MNENTDECRSAVIYVQSGHETRYDCALLPGHEGWHSNGYGFMWPVLDVEKAS